jgi:hypothetical protein
MPFGGGGGLGRGTAEGGRGRGTEGGGGNEGGGEVQGVRVYSTVVEIIEFI